MGTNNIHNRYLDAEERYEIFVVKAAERPHLLHWTPSFQENNDNIINDNDNHIKDDDHDDEKKVDDLSDTMKNSSIKTANPNLSNTEYPPPLIDGCDLPGWRCERISPYMNYSSTATNEKKNDDDSIRQDIESPLGGALNIGPSSTLFRRESQFPFISSSVYNNIYDNGENSNCWWYTAKQRFNIPPSIERAAHVLHHDEAAMLVDYDGSDDINIAENGQRCKRKITMFCKEYEIKNYPVKILGATDGWLAMPCYSHRNNNEANATDDIAVQDDDCREIHGNSWKDVGEKSELFEGGGNGGWTFSNLLSRFGNVAFRFSDTHGEMMSLTTYAKYITNPEGLLDDSPLGIYDSEFGDDDSPTRVLRDEYTVPKCFSTDLFDVVEDDLHTTRPPYRWVLIGPERSGTGMHVDPLWTHAWVTVLQGRKRWLLFPPNTPYESIGMIDGKPQVASSIWFRVFYDKVTSPSWPKEYQPVEVLQHPGETVYVPAGWPHLVLNLELTVAVTHNYASEFGPSFQRMCDEAVHDEPQFSLQWCEGLRKNGRQDLAAQIINPTK